MPGVLARALAPTVFTVGQRVPGALYAHPVAWATAGGAAAATTAVTPPHALAELVLTLLQRADAAGVLRAGALQGLGLVSGTLGGGHAAAAAAPQPAPAAADSRLWLAEWRPPQGFAYGDSPPLKKKPKGAGTWPVPASYLFFRTSWP